MRHRPHLFVEEPWPSGDLAISAEAERHLTKVLRYAEGGPVTYTDGEGLQGEGSWSGSRIVRSQEIEIPRPGPDVTLAVGPPRSRDRQRFIVEKAQELGVRSLVWLSTDYGQTKPPVRARAVAWARSALEQSKGAWLTDIAAETTSDLSDAVVLDADAPTTLAGIQVNSPITLAVGPEGGFSTSELESAHMVASIPTNMLRTDTAAIVSVAIIRALHR